MSNPLQVDPVPILPTSLLTLVDKKLIGTYDSLSEAYIIGPNASIRLREAPRQDVPSSIVIPGYVETTSIFPTLMQFVVDYGNGIITFNSAQIGVEVTVSYRGIGSIVHAADINNITSGLSQVMQRDTIVATLGQSVFNTSFSVSASSTLVYADGLLMTAGGSADYTITGSSQITFNTGRSTGSVINFIKIGN